MATPEQRIEGINTALKAVGLPDAETCARGGFGGLSPRIANMLYEILVPREREPDSLITPQLEEQLLDDRLTWLAEDIEQGWSSGLEPYRLPLRGEMDAVLLAKTFPVSAAHRGPFRTYPDDRIKALELMIGEGQPHDNLMDDMYEHVVLRPDAVRLPPEQARALRASAIQRALAAAMPKTPRILSDPSEFSHAGSMWFTRDLAVASQPHFAFAEDTEVFAFFYFAGEKADGDKEGKPENIRLYVTLRMAETENVGAHFVRIIDRMRDAGIPLHNSKAASPADAMVRRESMVIHVPKNHEEAACAVAQAYLEETQCGDPEIRAAMETITPGVGLGWEPRGPEAGYALAVTQQEEKRTSFNRYRAARAYPHVLERLLSEGELHADARTTYERERDRVRRLRRVVSPKLKADVEALLKAIAEQQKTDPGTGEEPK